MPRVHEIQQFISQAKTSVVGQFVAIGFQISEMVDDGVQQGLLVLGEGLGEGAGCGLGGLGCREGVHFGFLAELLEVQLGH